MKILEVPFPKLENGMVLVRNHFSVISAGTEGKTVRDARLGYVGKALARKDDVKKVMRSVKTLGLTETYRITMNKLDAPSALGYSCAGEVIAVASDVTSFKAGDKVACAGAGAVHAEVVAVPVNLCALVPQNVMSEHAAFATLGAIALQGLRQSELKLGENCVVIGLGLIGQLTLQLLKAAGIKAIGIDIDEKTVRRCRNNGHELAFHRNEEALFPAVHNHCNGFGADAVIITASASSDDPVNLAGELCRAKGKVVIVGNVPTGFERKLYYRKELDLRMSCSYGPGRYDSSYEEGGLDYPYAYVRWTEQRNMQAFLQLLEDKRIDLTKIISHVFPFRSAPEAYQLIIGKKEYFSGIVLGYDLEKEVKKEIHFAGKKAGSAKVKAALIGAGSFASNIMLPSLEGKCSFTILVTGRPNNSANIASRYGFSSCSSETGSVFSDPATNTVFIATRHHSHADYVLKSLQSGKHVFVEKPLCLTEEELAEIADAHNKSSSVLMVGFNRRFSPFVAEVKKVFSGGPVSINYRINAGVLPKDHWTQNPEAGGGRILGECCHFIDLCSFIAGAGIKTVSANALSDPHHLNDTLNIHLSFQNGSIASISYFSNGSKEMEKERIEIFGGGNSAVIDDFKSLAAYGKGGRKEESAKQDKGHKREFSEFIQTIEKGGASPIPFAELYNSTLATIKANESVKLGGRQISL